MASKNEEPELIVVPADRNNLLTTIPFELLPAWDAHPKVVKLGDPVLRQVAKPVDRVNEATLRLIEQMKEMMEAANGIGFAAPQIGVSTRILVYMNPDTEQVFTLINPQIISSRGESTSPKEGCLSIPGLQGTVVRAEELRVRAFDTSSRVINKKVNDLEARIIQHEIDHLNGVLFIDRAVHDTLEWVIGEKDPPS